MASYATSVSAPLLVIDNLQTVFRVQDGVIKAVDGVSFEVPAGRTVGLVGESGCGKTVTALSTMRLIDHPGRISSGTIRFRGIESDEIAMIFQEPMTSLNPVYTVGDQIAE